jgi:hypothetical protein
MLLSICGMPMRTFSKMGTSSEKLGISTRQYSGSDPHIIDLSLPASGNEVNDRLLEIIIYQTACEGEREGDGSDRWIRALRA